MSTGRRGPGVELPVQSQDSGRLITCNKNKCLFLHGTQFYSELLLYFYYSCSPSPCSAPGRLCSILPGTGTGRESKVSSTLLGLKGGVL